MFLDFVRAFPRLAVLFDGDVLRQAAFVFHVVAGVGFRRFGVCHVLVLSPLVCARESLGLFVGFADGLVAVSFFLF